MPSEEHTRLRKPFWTLADNSREPEVQGWFVMELVHPGRFCLQAIVFRGIYETDARLTMAVVDIEFRGIRHLPEVIKDRVLIIGLVSNIIFHLLVL